MKRTAPDAALPRGPLHYWKQMVAMSRRGGFTITEVHKASNGRSRQTVKDYVLFCAEHGHIALVGDQPMIKNRSANLYKVRDLRAPAPIQRRPDFADDRGRRAQQLWTAMRALRQFTIRELAIAASTDAVPVTVKRAREYVGTLAGAGYLAEVGHRAHPGLIAHWRLLPAKNTGPKAPATLAGGSILYDRNLELTVNLNDLAGRAA